MKLKEFNIILDIKTNVARELIEVVQFDYDSNAFNLTIMDELEPYNLTGLNIEIAFAKPDGTTVLQDQNSGVAIIDAQQGKIQCILRTNTIAAHGKVKAEVRLFENDTLLTTARFDFIVRKAIVNDETVESTNEFPILQQLINTTEDLIDQVSQIEQQVPENVVTQLNQVSNLANQLQIELNAHKADKAKYALFKMSANASIPNAEYTQIPFATKTPYNGEDFCEIDSATKKIKILKAGMYQVQVQIAFNPSATGSRMYWGDTTTHSFSTPAGGAFYQSITEFVYATAGQLLNNRVYQTSGSPLDLQATNTLVYVRKVV